MNLVLLAEGPRFEVWAVCSDGATLECEALEYLDGLLRTGAVAAHKSMWRCIRDLSTGQILGTGRCEHEGDDVYALKNHQGARLLFFYMKGGMAVISHGYPKKTQKLPAKEKAKAVKAKEHAKEEWDE
jgi:hypothetical protein